MKVKEKYFSGGSFIITTAQLIEHGVSARVGQVEALEAQVSHIIDVVAALIDHAGLSDAEILDITGCNYKYDLKNDA